ncbi:hypothetical protein ACWIG4_30410 [Streptomyces sp. NPDC002248]
MNLADARLWTYLTRARDFALTVPSYEGEKRCPECDSKNWADASHIWVTPPVNHHTDEAPILLMGCEGYWVIDPLILHMPRENWTPLFKEIDLDGPDWPGCPGHPNQQDPMQVHYCDGTCQK